MLPHVLKSQLTQDRPLVLFKYTFEYLTRCKKARNALQSGNLRANRSNWQGDGCIG
jgi:hypothetical protein